MIAVPEFFTRISDAEAVITTDFDAPRELVFKAWTDPDILKQWWAPLPWTLSACEVDLQVGGVWLYCMHGPDGTEGWGKGIYREIVAPERIVYDDAFVDEHGNPLDGMPLLHMTVNFKEMNGKTRVEALLHCDSAAELDQLVSMGMAEGIQLTSGQLAELLKHMAA